MKGDDSSSSKVSSQKVLRSDPKHTSEMMKESWNQAKINLNPLKHTDLVALKLVDGFEKNTCWRSKCPQDNEPITSVFLTQQIRSNHEKTSGVNSVQNRQNLLLQSLTTLSETVMKPQQPGRTGQFDELFDRQEKVKGGGAKDPPSDCSANMFQTQWDSEITVWEMIPLFPGLVWTWNYVLKMQFVRAFLCRHCFISAALLTHVNYCACVHTAPPCTFAECRCQPFDSTWFACSDDVFFLRCVERRAALRSSWSISAEKIATWTSW